MRRRHWLATTSVAAGALAAGAWWRARGDDSAAEAPIWSASFAQPGGGQLEMARLRGKPLILNFWATWCEPCLREMPALDRFARDFAAKGWQVVGLAIDSQAKVQEFLRRTPVSFPIAIGETQGLSHARALGNTQGGLPFTVVFGADGRIRERRSGETRFEELVAWTQKG